MHLAGLGDVVGLVGEQRQAARRVVVAVRADGDERQKVVALRPQARGNHVTSADVVRRMASRSRRSTYGARRSTVAGGSLTA